MIFLGTSTWYFEVGEDNYLTRQLTIYQNGKICRYSENNLEDEFGGLSDQVFDERDFEGEVIDKDSFEMLWKQ